MLAQLQAAGYQVYVDQHLKLYDSFRLLTLQNNFILVRLTKVFILMSLVYGLHKMILVRRIHSVNIYHIYDFEETNNTNFLMVFDV